MNTMLEAVATTAEPATAGAVLVADPNPASRGLMLHRLRSLGYAGLAAANGAQALALWRAGGVGMVIAEGQLTDMDAYGLARAIRAQESGNLTIVASWPHAFLLDLEACYDAGIDDYLPQMASLDALERLMALWMPAQDAARAS